jgi:hypothetical protein
MASAAKLDGLKKEQEQLGRNARGTQEAARAVLELAREKRREAQAVIDQGTARLLRSGSRAADPSDSPRPPTARPVSVSMAGGGEMMEAANPPPKSIILPGVFTPESSPLITPRVWRGDLTATPKGEKGTTIDAIDWSSPQSARRELAVVRSPAHQQQQNTTVKTLVSVMPIAARSAASSPAPPPRSASKDTTLVTPRRYLVDEGRSPRMCASCQKEQEDRGRDKARATVREAELLQHVSTLTLKHKEEMKQLTDQHQEARVRERELERQVRELREREANRNREDEVEVDVYMYVCVHSCSVDMYAYVYNGYNVIHTICVS